VARRLGAFVLILGLLVTACLISMGLLQWGYTSSDPRYSNYAIRRVGYTLATRTDVPAIQLILTGLFTTMAARRRPGSEREGDSGAPVPAGVLDEGDGDSDVTGPRSLP
jgi:hypothetical protein